MMVTAKRIAHLLYPEGAVRTVLLGARGLRFRVAPSMGATYAFGCGYHPRDYATWVKKGMRVLDIGANRGQSTLILRYLTGEGGALAACEPVPEMFAKLQENLALNSFGNVHALQVAIAAAEGDVEFEYSPEFSTQGKISGVERHYLVGETSRRRVKTMTLDQLVERTGIAPDFIKVDVEGAAAGVFEGGETALTKKRPLIFVELHGPEEQAAVQLVIDRYGYRAEDLGGQPVPRVLDGWHSPLLLRP